jgi:hypothetical protein
MNHPYNEPYYYEEDERLFSFPGLGSFFGPGSQPSPPSVFPGQPVMPGFPAGGAPGPIGGGVGFPGSGTGQQVGAPTSPPPAFTPELPSFQTFAVDPGGIRSCLFRFTYVWLNNNEAFWFYPTFVGRNSIAGFRWIGFRWVYFGIDLNRIQSFQCF